MKKIKLGKKYLYPIFTITKICNNLDMANEELKKFLEKKKDNRLAKHTRYYDEYFLMVKDEFSVYHHQFGEIKLTKGLYHLSFWFK